jgi:hypothetical protein
LVVGLALSAGLYLAACGGSDMTSPSKMAGATLKGTVKSPVAGSGVSASSVHAMSGSSGITITVTETGASTVTDSSGHFVLTNLPGGTVTLHFTGSGIDATLTLSGLVDGQTLTITVTVTGRHAHLDDDSPEPSPSPSSSPEPSPSPSDFCFANGAKAEVEGNISAEDASSITVRQQGKGDFQCQVTDSTTIRHGNTHLTLADLKVGNHVHVSGTGLGSLNGVCQVNASEIKLQ